MYQENHHARKLIIISTIVLLGATGLLRAADTITVKTNLQNAIQHIATVIFANQIRDNTNRNGSRNPQGQVEVTSNAATVLVSGALLTNYDKGNTTNLGSTAKGFSILGGKTNAISGAQSSTIIGGQKNTIYSPQSVIAGGSGNVMRGT
jgi:hypothetical protein